MNVKVQKQLAAKVLGCSPSRVVFDTVQLATIKEALTRADIRDLINSNAIRKAQVVNQSHVRARHNAQQKSRGLRKGPGSRKGPASSRSSPKDAWVARVRLQREFLAGLRDSKKVSSEGYRSLYAKVKANQFKSREALKLFMNEHSLFIKK